MTELYFRENIVHLENFRPIGQAVLNILINKQTKYTFQTTLYLNDTQYTDMHL